MAKNRQRALWSKRRFFFRESLNFDFYAAYHDLFGTDSFDFGIHRSGCGFRFPGSGFGVVLRPGFGFPGKRHPGFWVAGWGDHLIDPHSRAEPVAVDPVAANQVP